jgi:hypothetical protein
MWVVTSDGGLLNIKMGLHSAAFDLVFNSPHRKFCPAPKLCRYELARLARAVGGGANDLEFTASGSEPKELKQKPETEPNFGLLVTIVHPLADA